jgi:glycosyltransferase involved in cell wall biosynthesis
LAVSDNPIADSPPILAAPAAPATVVITTKNRRGDLAKAIESALDQTIRPEVLVIDDGSADSTADMVRQRYPKVRLDRAEQSLGYIAQRNRAAQLVTGEIIFSIDDDAAFSTARIVEQTLADFDHPRVGAVAIPVIDVKKSPQVRQRSPDLQGIFANYTFVGTAHALRRNLFLRLGGYREYLFHQGEESDFAIRLLDAGFIVRLGRSDPIHHFESPRRDFRRMDLYGRRNDVLYAWHNVPMPYLPLHLLATTFNGVRFGFACRRPWRMMRGLAIGYGSILHELARRRPVSCATYRLSRMLKTRGGVALKEIEPLLKN